MARKTEASPRGSSKAAEDQVSTITLPVVHASVVPEQLAYFGALGVLAALELIEWPIAVVLVAGHVIATRAHRKVVREIATGVDEAV